MAITLVEYGGFQSGRPFSVGIPTAPPINVTQFSSAAVSTGFLLPQTRFVQVFSAGVNAWVLFTATTSSTIALSTATSTNGIPIPANAAPQGFYVTPNPATINGTSTATSTSGFRYSFLSS